MKWFVVSVMVVVVGVGCASGETSRVANEGTGPLMGLEGERHDAPWAEWRAAPGRSVPAGLGEQMIVFDGWRSSEREVVEKSWRGVFTVLDRMGSDGVSSDEVGRAARGVTYLLEPGSGTGLEAPVVLEASYLVRPEAFDGEAREGVALRFYRRVKTQRGEGTAASLTVWMTRPPAGARTPDRVVIWGNTGFQEAGTMTLMFRRGRGEESGGWQRWSSGGLVMPVGWEEASGTELGRVEASEASGLMASVLVENLWEANVGASYAGSDRRAGDAAEPPSPMAPFLGLEQGDRGVRRVYSGSVFPPRPE